MEAQQIFLAALDGEPGQPRPVPYVRDKWQQTVQFSGGIIAISNMPLKHDPVLNALKSRVIPLEFEPTDEQIAAFMRHLASKGFMAVTPSACREVVEFIITESKNCDHRLDLRHMTKGFQDYRQWRDGKTRTLWQELVRSSLRQRIVPNEESFSDSQMAQQRKIVVELLKEYPHRKDKLLRDAEWVKLTGKSPDTFYRRVREMKMEGLL